MRVATPWENDGIAGRFTLQLTRAKQCLCSVDVGGLRPCARLVSLARTSCQVIPVVPRRSYHCTLQFTCLWSVCPNRLSTRQHPSLACVHKLVPRTRDVSSSTHNPPPPAVAHTTGSIPVDSIPHHLFLIVSPFQLTTAATTAPPFHLEEPRLV